MGRSQQRFFKTFGVIGIIIRRKNPTKKMKKMLPMVEASDSYAAELSRHFDTEYAVLRQPSVAVDRAQ